MGLALGQKTQVLLHKPQILNSISEKIGISPKTFLESLIGSKALITIEEHSIYGGLGEKCASIISQSNINIAFKILGFPDEYMTNGSQSDVLDHYDMEPEKISKIAKKMLK